ncbi:MAG TPA: hypothetical protein VGK48_11740 [Terriglobia bacterium]|jgi:hypothetical protein
MTDLILQILQLTLSLAEEQLKGQSGQSLAIGQILLQIVQKGADAYRLHTGQPLDVSLIQPEAQI